MERENLKEDSTGKEVLERAYKEGSAFRRWGAGGEGSGGQSADQRTAEIRIGSSTSKARHPLGEDAGSTAEISVAQRCGEGRWARQTRWRGSEEPGARDLGCCTKAPPHQACRAGRRGLTTDKGRRR
ncbi:pollen-specific leucine-rich repeat extensin-like protein 4 [Iris pallida]|nr:pollen-specific leucine-rich repeat extensin-like protein 4 [Iris pallida]